MRYLALALCVLACGAQAADNGTEAYFRSLDLDGDGYVSLAEAAGDAVVVNRFDRADRNRDGKLSAKEFANLRKVKVRVAKSKKGKEAESAAVGGTAPAASSKERSARRAGGG
jgi:Ca2+-binding EF-hand superfamily protein